MNKKLFSVICGAMVLGSLASASAAGLPIESRDSAAYKEWKAKQEVKVELAINPEALTEGTMHPVETPMWRYSRPKDDLTYKVPVYTAAYKRWKEKVENDLIPVSNPDVYYEGERDINIPKVDRDKMMHKKTEGRLPTGKLGYCTDPVRSMGGDYTDWPVNVEKVEGDWHDLHYSADVNIEPVTAEDVRFDGYHSDVHR